MYRRKRLRDLPWRKNITPYRICLSEIMLQQTQVQRVIKKYKIFINKYSGFSALAKASKKEVLALWQGLGYNKRALALRELAKAVVDRHHGHLPKEFTELCRLPGIGPATAGAIQVYAFNQPAVFIETNIRTVLIYHFFKNKKQVSDTELIPFLKKMVDRKNPRRWYWAMMDYGTELKRTVGNLNQQSKHYSRQSKFAGSHRQARGQLLKTLLRGAATRAELCNSTSLLFSKVDRALKDFQKENLVNKKGNKYYIQ